MTTALRTAKRAGAPAAMLAGLVAAVAIVAAQAWFAIVFVAFAIAMAYLERDEVRLPGVIGLAIGIAAALGIAGIGLYMVAMSPYALAGPCDAEPCARIGPPLLYAGIGVLIVAAICAAVSVLYLRRPRTTPILGPALRVFLVGLFVASVMNGSQSGGSVVEIAGVTAAAVVLPIALDRSGLLRAALLAQVADLATFGLVWAGGLGEQNPLGRWTIELMLPFDPSRAPYPWSWGAAAAAGVILILAKLGLLALLIRLAPQLGRYRRAVLLAAAVAGGIGAIANALAAPMFLPVAIVGGAILAAWRFVQPRDVARADPETEPLAAH